MTATRVLVADDHPTFRRGLRALIDSLPGIELIGEAADGEAAVAQAAQLLPDVVVMDLNMPGLNGVEATRRIVAANPGIAVLVLTMLDEDEPVFAAMRAGARGYVVKGADTDNLLRALESVARGDVVFGPAVASRVLSYLTRPLSARDPVLFPELSDREREVLEFLARGMTNSQIARKLVVSPKTVRNHVSNIFTKLQVNDRAEAVRRAQAAGLGGYPARQAARHTRRLSLPGGRDERRPRPTGRPAPARFAGRTAIRPEDNALPYPSRSALPLPTGTTRRERSFWHWLWRAE